MADELTGLGPNLSDSAQTASLGVTETKALGGTYAECMSGTSKLLRGCTP